MKYFLSIKIALSLLLRLCALLGLVCIVEGCSKPEPIKIGFVAGLTGRGADLGTSSLHGALLAVEKRNVSGGVSGRQIELIVRDDGQNPEIARRVVKELIEEKVVAIIGHVTSSMSMATVSVANEAKMLMISPTTTTNKLSGKDDHFFRVINPTRSYATKIAEFYRHNLKKSRIAFAYDKDNLSYSQGWMNDFRTSFEHEGGRVVAAVEFSSGPEVNFRNLAQELVSIQPDSILIVANALDAALICQQVRALDPNIQIGTSEWASTEQVIELGGRAVEGVYQSQFIDRFNTHPEFLAFQQTYLKRFGKEPGFSGVTSFDAANVIIDALIQKKEGVSLKETVLSIGTFSGLQEQIVFDPYGDAPRKNFITVIKNGQFRVIQP